ncbi:MAG: hypothetical protein MUE97_04725 [Phycisphaerales bacterium]|jgi:hypothetical protein|nr:hypothetical protein [Phycisphaerales bacterium]
MQPSPIQLLSRLAGASSPGGGGLAASRQAHATDPFAALLAGAKRLAVGGNDSMSVDPAGQIASERPVSIDASVAGSVSLSPQQQVRLSGAIDQAEAAGISSALVLIDGMAMVVDVGARQISRVLGDEPGVLDGIDGVVTVAPQTWSRLGAAGVGSGPDAEHVSTSTLASSQALLSSLNASAIASPLRSFGRAS